MRRIAAAASMALAVHALAFTMCPQGRQHRSAPAIRHESLSVALTSRVDRVERPENHTVLPEPPAPKPVENKKPVPRKKERGIPPTPGKVREKIPGDAPVPPEPTVLPSHPSVDSAAGDRGGDPDPGSIPADSPDSIGRPPPVVGHVPAPAQPLREAVPMYRSNPVPEYPAAARRRGYEGTVVLEVLVNRVGKVMDFRLAKSSGHAILDQTALSSVKTWVFEPAIRGEEPVEMWVRIPVCFHLKD